MTPEIVQYLPSPPIRQLKGKANLMNDNFTNGLFSQVSDILGVCDIGADLMIRNWGIGCEFCSKLKVKY